MSATSRTYLSGTPRRLARERTASVGRPALTRSATSNSSTPRRPSTPAPSTGCGERVGTNLRAAIPTSVLESSYSRSGVEAPVSTWVPAADLLAAAEPPPGDAAPKRPSPLDSDGPRPYPEPEPLLSKGDEGRRAPCPRGRSSRPRSEERR